MNNNQLIPAYDQKEIPYKSTWDQYIKETVLTKTPIEAIKYIKNYLKENSCNEEVETFLNYVLSDIQLLNKIQITFDGSYRNITFLVRPDELSYTGYYNNKNYVESYQEKISYYKDKAEIIFLNMTEETGEEADEWLKEIEEMIHDELEEDF